VPISFSERSHQLRSRTGGMDLRLPMLVVTVAASRVSRSRQTSPVSRTGEITQPPSPQTSRGRGVTNEIDSALRASLLVDWWVSFKTSAERRQLTVMMTDLLVRPRWRPELDAEDPRAIIGGYHRCTAKLVKRPAVREVYGATALWPISGMGEPRARRRAGSTGGARANRVGARAPRQPRPNVVEEWSAEQHPASSLCPCSRRAGGGASRCLLFRRPDVAERKQQDQVVGDLQAPADQERQPRKRCGQERPATAGLMEDARLRGTAVTLGSRRAFRRRDHGHHVRGPVRCAIRRTRFRPSARVGTSPVG